MDRTALSMQRAGRSIDISTTCALWDGEQLTFRGRVVLDVSLTSKEKLQAVELSDIGLGRLLAVVAHSSQCTLIPWVSEPQRKSRNLVTVIVSV